MYTGKNTALRLTTLLYAQQDKRNIKKVKRRDFLRRFHGQAENQGSHLEGGNCREMVGGEVYRKLDHGQNVTGNKSCDLSASPKASHLYSTEELRLVITLHMQHEIARRRSLSPTKTKYCADRVV